MSEAPNGKGVEDVPKLLCVPARPKVSKKDGKSGDLLVAATLQATGS